MPTIALLHSSAGDLQKRVEAFGEPSTDNSSVRCSFVAPSSRKERRVSLRVNHGVNPVTFRHCRQRWWLTRLWLAWVMINFAVPSTAYSEDSSHGQQASINPRGGVSGETRIETLAPSDIESDELGNDPHLQSTRPMTPNVIVIGFVGGFVSPNDQKHPEVQFAAYLRDRYPSIHSEAFGNHHGGKALHYVVRLLDTDHDGSLTSIERERAKIIVYGHSWGASETAVFARELGQIGIPVLLTIQVDTIAKPGHDGRVIPSNVASAINFYQARGPLHGNPEIVAADPGQTKVLGNLRMTYEDRTINCDNYSWYARVLNKPHHEIENDLRVWDAITSLIDSDLSASVSRSTAPLPSSSPFFIYLRRDLHVDQTH